MDWPMGKILIIVGMVAVLAGILMMLNVPIGKLPGDISIKGQNTQVYIPITTSIIISIILSFIFYLFSKG